MFYVVPNKVSEAIDERLNAALAECPDAEKDRAFLRGQLIEAFAQYGHIPEFTLTARQKDDTP